jgi:sporulation protein YlmC with PRC-barrel domain
MFTGSPDSGTEISNSRRLIQEENVASEDRLRELEEKYEDYKVFDNQGEKIGKVDDLFVDETDSEEYIGVKMGFLGLKSTLIPMEIVRVNEGERTIEVSETKNHVRNAPSFDDDEDITPDYEYRIRSYFGLESPGSSEGGYDDRSSADPEYGSTEESEGASEAGSSLGSTGSSTDESNREASTTRHTEETIQEDGRTKIRRRVIREEIIEDDDPKSHND